MTDLIQTVTLLILAIGTVANSISISRHNKALGHLSTAVTTLSTTTKETP